MTRKLNVKGSEISVISENGQDFISLSDMLKAKDGDFFISDWLRNRNSVEFLGIWETVHNPDFNYGEFAIINSHAGSDETLAWMGDAGARPTFVKALECSCLAIVWHFRRDRFPG